MINESYTGLEEFENKDVVEWKCIRCKKQGKCNNYSSGGCPVCDAGRKND